METHTEGLIFGVCFIQRMCQHIKGWLRSDALQQLSSSEKPALILLKPGIFTEITHTTPKLNTMKWLVWISFFGLGSAQHAMEFGNFENLSGKAFDRAFLSMMIPHHEEAIGMAKAVLNSKNAQIQKWASDIIKTQQSEINTMNKMLKMHGGSEMHMQHTMKSNMMGMSNTIKTSKKPDQAFVEGMIKHHGSALHMAHIALEISKDPEILKMARDILKVQADEVYAFKNWLK